MAPLKNVLLCMMLKGYKLSDSKYSMLTFQLNVFRQCPLADFATSE